MTIDREISGRSSSEQGFTIIELLVSLTIIALMLVLMTDGLRILTKNSDEYSRRVEHLDMLARTYDILDRDVSALQRVVVVGERQATRYIFRGDRSRMLFVANEPRYPTQAGAFYIEYAIEASGGKIKLTRTRAPFVEPSLLMPAADLNNRVILLEGMNGVEFAYGDKSTAKPRWLPSWNDADRLPDLIRLQLREPKSGAAISPPMIVALKTDAELTCLSRDLEICSPQADGSIAPRIKENGDASSNP